MTTALPIGLVGFDLGNTLVRYFTSREFPDLLADAIARVSELVRARGLAVPEPADLRRRVAAENYEAPDFSVRPVEERLGRIFGIDDARLLDAMAVEFVAPLLARSRLYEDTLPVLQELRQRGIRTALVSNTPWGSPAGPWRQELGRYGLDRLLDVVVFCRDIGWRKPSPRIFHYLLAVTDARADQTLFVGDHPVWDVEGPRACGLRAVLLDREGVCPQGARGLEDVLRLVAAG